MATPYFPLYPADFEADTSHLTLQEDGAYNRLLRLAWMTPGCSVPDDDAWIARRMRVTAEEFEAYVRPVIDEFFKRSRGRVFNTRLRKEHEKVSGSYLRRSQAGKKGGRPKAIENIAKDVKQSLSIDKGNRKQPEPEPYNTPIVPKDGDEFDVFWSNYPHRNGVKKNRAGAVAKYRAAIKRGVPEADILAGVERMKKSPDVVRGFARDPVTWLNNAGWEDEISEAAIAAAKREPEIGDFRKLKDGRVQTWIGGYDGWINYLGHVPPGKLG